ncbi:MAG: hypothetical protein FWG17_01235 [Desulfovibrionaceae bacterium]|nr:hypothetical protein [Desulfovibrionaceae bacterium]
MTAGFQGVQGERAGCRGIHVFTTIHFISFLITCITSFTALPVVAVAIMAEKGVLPVNFGRGRGRGVRWYTQAVEAILRQMHDDAQAKNPPKRSAPRLPKPGLVMGRPIDELYAELTGRPQIQ